MSPITNLLGQLPNQLLLTVLGRLLIEWGPLPNVIGQLHNGWDPLCDVNVRAVT